MIYNIYIDKENFVESYITYYDPIKCKFEKINNTNLNEFKLLVYSIVSDYLNEKYIFNFEYIINPIIKNIDTFNKLLEFLISTQFLENGKYKFEIINNYVKYTYITTLI